MKQLCEICGGKYHEFYNGMTDHLWQAYLESSKQSDNLYIELSVL